MSRSYRFLALALAALLVLVGVAKVLDGGEDTSAASVSGVPSATEPSGATTGASAGDASGTAAPADGLVTDEVDGDMQTTSTTAPPQTAACSITTVLKVGSSGDEVTCLEQQLSAAGYLTAAADGTFDDTTDTAVRAYQSAFALEVDGIVGRQTAQSMGIWAGPLGPLPATDADCPSTSHGAIVDRANQRAALCENGHIIHEFPMTSAWSQPDPGTYEVYAKDLNASSNLTGQYSTMTHFVAFTRGKYKGARIAFHSIPKYSNGEYVQPLESVGTEAYHGESSGCIRVLPEDAVRIWDWLSIGDEVHVIS